MYAFPYLGRTILYNNIYWAAMNHNLRNNQRLWGVISKFLKKTGAAVRTRGMLYKSVAKTVLLYGSVSWVVTEDIFKVLQGFHHRAARRIAVVTDRGTEEEEWE